MIEFTSAPLTGDPDYLDFAVFGDMGTIIPFGHWVSKQIERDNDRHHYNFSLLAGDVAYAGISSE